MEQEDAISRSALANSIIEKLTIDKRSDGTPILSRTITTQELTKLLVDAPTIDVGPKWISVKDRLPDAYQPVIVHVRHTKKWRNTVLTDRPWHVVEEDIWLGDKWSNNADDDIHEVTHWMPLPEPPKEANDGH